MVGHWLRDGIFSPEAGYTLVSTQSFFIVKREKMYYFKYLKRFILLELLFGYPMLADFSAVAAENESLQSTQALKEMSSERRVRPTHY